MSVAKTDAERTREKMDEYRQAIADSETKTGLVTFPDNDLSRVQICLSDGNMGVDIPNTLDQVKTPNSLNWNVVRFDGDIVEFER